MRLFHSRSILLSVLWPCFASSGNHCSKDTTESLNRQIDLNRFLQEFSDFGVFDLPLQEDFKAPDGITLTVESLYGLYVPSPKNKLVILDNDSVALILNYEMRVIAKASHKEMKNFLRAKFVSEKNVLTFKAHLKHGVLSLEENTVQIEINRLLYDYLISCESTNIISNLENPEDPQIVEFETKLLRLKIQLGTNTEAVLLERMKTIIKRVIVAYNGVDFDIQNKEILVGTFFRNHAGQIFGKTWTLPPDVRKAFEISEDSLNLTISEALENSNGGINVTVKLDSFKNFHLSTLKLTETDNQLYVTLYLHIEAILRVYDNISNKHIATARTIMLPHQMNQFKYAVSNKGNKLQLQKPIWHQLGKLQFSEIEYSEPENNNLKYSKTLLETKLNGVSIDIDNFRHLLQARTKISIMWAFYRYNNGSLPIWRTEEESLRVHSRVVPLNIHPTSFNTKIPFLNLDERGKKIFDAIELLGNWKIPKETDRTLNLRLYQCEDLILQMTIPLKGKVWYKSRNVFIMIGFLHVTYVLEYDSKKTLTFKSASPAKIRNVNFLLLNDSGFDQKQLTEIRASVEASGFSYNKFTDDILSRLHILFKMYNNRIAQRYVGLINNKVPVLTNPLPQNLIWSFKLTNKGPEATLKDISWTNGEIQNVSYNAVQFRLNSVKLTYNIRPSKGVIIEYEDLLYRVHNKRNFFEITSIDTKGICEQPTFLVAEGTKNLMDTVNNIDLEEHRKRLTNVVIHYYTPLLVDALMTYLERMLDK